MSVPSKPWPVAVFETLRPHMTDFARDTILPLLEDEECRRIVVRAPVKSGKREIVEYLAMRDAQAQGEASTRAHAFLSAWHRVADGEQREELGHQNLVVFSINNTAALELCLGWVISQTVIDKKVVLHLDECDHGSGSNSLLSKLWTEIRSNELITVVLYSATPEEVLYSGEVDNEDINNTMRDMLEGHHVRYTPPEGYCGPRKFLDADLVHVALPFFHKEPGSSQFVLTEQGKEIVRELKEAIATNPRRNVVVLRLSYASGGNKIEHKAIHQFIRACGSFPELEGVDVVADIGAEALSLHGTPVIKQTVEWSNPVFWRRNMPVETPTIILIDKKSSRSTEWACHDRVFATHDFRNSAVFSTISQAVERVNHYSQKYGGFQPIRVYCHRKTMLLSAGKISYESYVTDEWEARKVDRRTSGGAEVYAIRRKAAPHKLHPSYPTPVDVFTKERILQELECGATSMLSARVTGSVSLQRVYRTEFFPVTEDSWYSFVHDSESPLRQVTRSMFKTPFHELAKSKVVEGVWKGRLPSRKGEALWRVLDYERDVKNMPSWGHTDIQESGMDKDLKVICYREGVLGVAFRIDTGARQTVNSLKSYRSMYGTPLRVVRLG